MARKQMKQLQEKKNKECETCWQKLNDFKRRKQRELKKRREGKKN